MILDYLLVSYGLVLVYAIVQNVRELLLCKKISTQLDHMMDFAQFCHSREYNAQHFTLLLEVSTFRTSVEYFYRNSSVGIIPSISTLRETKRYYEQGHRLCQRIAAIKKQHVDEAVPEDPQKLLSGTRVHTN